ncbi:hypothetical protein P153DRAFT_430422 [Dothidotthia symphoricarpi CBS 119687]|uniref:Stc1 domain-containing protein n=1 Tax=Dothidotthia symphoricarpi CBS 119687 TaxID=1392245 RepID=A0A6A6AJC6_9PLEO|nr:uncharacterized protein P153DRAFT_430422 [Dothidotthia symphoricarpi CBS 119687]KAF2131205.1 hypothetical protein P153DRAFT_430422 [Dothidotthia symphoricarpi CBS 119687]
MGARDRNKNFGAYDQNDIDRLRGVPLPEKIKCGRCNKNFNHANFSTKQLTDARFQIRNQGRIVKNPNCQRCTGKQVVEIECIMCHKTQGLEAFARVQRKNPSDAKCYKCMDEQVALAAVDDDTYEDPKKAFITPDHSRGRIPEYWTSSSASTDDSFSTAGDNDSETTYNDSIRDDLDGGGISLSNHFRHTLSVSGSVPETLIETEYALPAADHSWSEVCTKSWHTKSVTATSSGFNPNKYGNPNASATASSSRSVHSFASSVAERSDSSERIETRASGFAKVRAFKPSAPLKDDTSSESEEEEVDDGSDDDDDTVI